MLIPNPRALTLLALLLLAPVAPAAPPATQSAFKTYDSLYYTVHTDLEPDRAREAVLRVTRMAEEYRDRTRAFSGAIRGKFPFHLFARADDYHAAGGIPGTAGVFLYNAREARLMAVATNRRGHHNWTVVQHEGFHQYASAVIGGHLPIWLNEGLAEYFGEAVFTGDGFVTGVVSPARCQRVQHNLRENRFKTIPVMMLITHGQWNRELDYRNYDMAWSMTHFLAHGENGKYQTAFAQFVRDLGAGQPWPAAWDANFGSTDGFEKKWADYWLALDPNPTRDLYAKATVATLTSYLGRATAQGQTFDDLNEFLRTAKSGDLKIPDDHDWLPPALLASALTTQSRLGDDITYALSKDPKTPQLTATLPDATRITATYHRTAKPGPARVTTTLDDLAPRLAQARNLLAAKKKPEAKSLLLDAIKRNPKSPLVEEARKLLPQTL